MSGHGSRRCQASVSSSRGGRAPGRGCSSSSSASSASRCRTSSVTHSRSPGAHGLELRLVAGAPRVGDRLARQPERRRLLGDARAPVDTGAEDVEEEGLQPWNWDSSVEPRHRGRLGLAAGDRHRDLLEVARADLVLVLDGRVAVVLVGELGLLQVGVGGHAVLAVAAGELEHRVVERVEAGQRDELERVAELAELLWKPAISSSSSLPFQLNEGEQL